MPNLIIISYKLTTNLYSYVLINTHYTVDTFYNRLPQDCYMYCILQSTNKDVLIFWQLPSFCKKHGICCCTFCHQCHKLAKRSCYRCISCWKLNLFHDQCRFAESCQNFGLKFADNNVECRYIFLMMWVVHDTTLTFTNSNPPISHLLGTSLLMVIKYVIFIFW